MINLVLIINIFYKILIIPIQIEKSSKTEIQNICSFFSKKKRRIPEETWNFGLGGGGKKEHLFNLVKFKRND